MHVISTAAHHAYLEPVTGFGLLVRPVPADDLPSPFTDYTLIDDVPTMCFGQSVQQTDWELDDSATGPARLGAEGG